MKIDMRLWAKIAATIGIILFFDQLYAVLTNYTVYAMSSPYYWLYLAYKVVPMLIFTIPLLYYGFKKAS